MTWKTLGESLEAALASALNGDDGSAPTLPVSRKEPGPKPRQVKRTREQRREGETTAVPARDPMVTALPKADRSIATAAPTRRPTSAVVIDLAVYREERRHWTRTPSAWRSAFTR